MKTKTAGHTESRWWSPSVIHTTWYGRVDGSVMSALHEDLKKQLDGKTARAWLSDTTAVESYSVDIREPATKLLSFLKQNGISEIVGVVNSPTVRMLSTSLSFVVGLKIKMFPTFREAQAYASTLG